MESTVKDVIHWKKKLQRITDEGIILNVIHKLSKVLITVDVLQDTGIGKVIRGLTKHPGKIGIKAAAVLHNWRKIVASAQKTPEIPSKSVMTYNSKKRDGNSKDRLADEKCKQSIQESKHMSHECKKHVKGKNSSEFDFKKKSSINGTAEQLSMNKIIKEHKHNLSKREVSYNPLYNLDSELKTESNPVSYNPPELLSTDVTDKEGKLLNSESIPLSRKRKLEETEFPEIDKRPSKIKKHKSESSKLTVLQSSQSKYGLNKDSDHNSVKKRREKKSHCSNDQSIKNSFHKSQLDHSHNISEKQKLKESKKDKYSEKSHSKLRNIKIKSTEAFTSSEVRFEDCLSFNDIVTVKRKKSSKTSKSSEKKESGDYANRNVSGSSKHKYTHYSNSIRTPNIQENKISSSLEPSLPTHVPITKTSAVDIVSTLPQTQPYYRPLPQRNFDFYPQKKKVLSNEDAIKFTSSRREKTAVYSGRKNLFFTEVPSLFECCTRILIENIDAIEWMGGEVPFFLLKPVLERCTAVQLSKIEEYNPYLLEETQDLWEIHCKKDFRNHNPEETETWRDLYWRSDEERKKRLKTLTANISASMWKSKPGRQVKLAYVDSFVKPPRDVARKQAKNGTAVPVNHIVKAGPASKVIPRPTAPALNVATASNSKVDFIPKKPKVAPLMAKTLKSMKQCFRR